MEMGQNGEDLIQRPNFGRLPGVCFSCQPLLGELEGNRAHVLSRACSESVCSSQLPATSPLTWAREVGWAVQWKGVPRPTSLKCRATGLATPEGGRYRRLKEHLTRGNCLNICRFELYRAGEIEISVRETTLLSGSSHTLLKRCRDLSFLSALTCRQNGPFPSRCRAGLAWFVSHPRRPSAALL